MPLMLNKGALEQLSVTPQVEVKWQNALGVGQIRGIYKCHSGFALWSSNSQMLEQYPMRNVPCACLPESVIVSYRPVTSLSQV